MIKELDIINMRQWRIAHQISKISMSPSQSQNKYRSYTIEIKQTFFQIRYISIYNWLQVHTISNVENTMYRGKPLPY